MMGDAAALEQVVLNLLLNAAQASRKMVLVTVESSPHDVTLIVSDDGPGLPEDVRSRIFEPFFTTREEGTGLGLPVARVIVEAHGGTIEIGDAEEGACFRLRLPRFGNGS